MLILQYKALFILMIGFGAAFVLFIFMLVLLCFFALLPFLCLFVHSAAVFRVLMFHAGLLIVRLCFMSDIELIVFLYSCKSV